MFCFTLYFIPLFYIISLYYIFQDKEDAGAAGGTPGNATDSEDKGSEAMSPCRVSNILKSLRAYRKREFKPNQKVRVICC